MLGCLRKSHPKIQVLTQQSMRKRQRDVERQFLDWESRKALRTLLPAVLQGTGKAKKICPRPKKTFGNGKESDTLYGGSSSPDTSKAVTMRNQVGISPQKSLHSYSPCGDKAKSRRVRWDFSIPSSTNYPASYISSCSRWRRYS